MDEAHNRQLWVARKGSPWLKSRGSFWKDWILKLKNPCNIMQLFSDSDFAGWLCMVIILTNNICIYVFIYLYCVLYSFGVIHIVIYIWDVVCVYKKADVFSLFMVMTLISEKMGSLVAQCGPKCWMSFSPIMIVGWSTRRMVGSVDSFEENAILPACLSQRPCGSPFGRWRPL